MQQFFELNGEGHYALLEAGGVDFYDIYREENGEYIARDKEYNEELAKNLGVDADKMIWTKVSEQFQFADV